MFIDVAFVPSEARRWRDAVCIVVDVLRASTTIVTLFEEGCETVIPVRSVAEARRLAREYGYLLAGERNGLAPPGFDFGNSPSELVDADLAGRAAVLVTSNGTVTLARLADAPAVLVGCLRNATACCEKGVSLALRYGAALNIVCAGRHGRFVLDDAVCAGFLVDKVESLLQPSGAAPVLGDAARAARRLWRAYPDFDAPFRESASGRRIVEIGCEADLTFCSRTDASQIVPILVRSSPPHLERLG